MIIRVCQDIKGKKTAPVLVKVQLYYVLQFSSLQMYWRNGLTDMT